MLDNLLERLRFARQRRQIRRQFREGMGFDVDFTNPRTYQEKVQYRKLHGNHEFYALVADKVRARDYVAARAGTACLVPLCGVFERLTPDVFADLPRQFIIKANHGCKWNQVVRDKAQLDVPAAVRHFNQLRLVRYGSWAAERHYDFIPPRILIEELLLDDDGGLPWDYSFFCYHHAGKFDYSLALGSPDRKAAFLTSDDELLSSEISNADLALRRRPSNYDAMVHLARALSAEFDFVRVDLYSVRGHAYFGELTCTPNRGYNPISDERRQRMRDEMWHLDAYNPRLYRPPPKGFKGGQPPNGHAELSNSASSAGTEAG